MSVYDCISHLRWGYWAAAQTCLRDFIPQTPFSASRRLKEVGSIKSALRFYAEGALLFFNRLDYSSGFAPITALMRRTPAEEDSSF